MSRALWRGLVPALLVAFVLSPAAAPDEVQAAVAANFAGALKKIVAKFTAQTGHTVVVSLGSSGKAVQKIKEGGPFDVFLSADAARPEQLEKEGLAVAGSRFTYAVGRLVLWSANAGTVDERGEVLHTGDFRHLAIANPKNAPYGEAARQVLEKLGLWDTLAPRLVQGEDLAQTFQFVATGNAELGFVSASQVSDGKTKTGGEGSSWTVPRECYRPIEQQAALLTRAKDNAAAKAFLEFLRGEEARALIRESGYDTPQGR